MAAEGRMGEEPCPAGIEATLLVRSHPSSRAKSGSIRTRLQVSGAERDLALFNLAIDSKLRGCDLVTVTVGDVALRHSFDETHEGCPDLQEDRQHPRCATAAWAHQA
ncbi:hypothetical protein MES4922_300177 [Mesorhizobium ventifaucium]|uniref:Uncharacterized protein n=1 Tax=Mesorhizobium ventifaucium TaxID=666020 RepID=A0ABN8JYE3_9HYPH|nr:hypothetical protein MES4922_300177 [Mesorhizobium ventifaucium]